MPPKNSPEKATSADSAPIEIGTGSVARKRFRMPGDKAASGGSKSMLFAAFSAGARTTGPAASAVDLDASPPKPAQPLQTGGPKAEASLPVLPAAALASPGRGSCEPATVQLDVSACARPAVPAALAAAARVPVPAPAAFPPPRAAVAPPAESSGSGCNTSLVPPKETSGALAAAGASAEPPSKARRIEATPSPSPPQQTSANVGATSVTTSGTADARPALPLQGVVMCFTGELDKMTRADAEEKAKAAGAKVMGSCSSNTAYLVLGSHLDDGRKVEETSKYKKYLELKEKGKKWPELLDEAKFIALLPAEAAPKPSAAPVVPPPAVSSDAPTRNPAWVDSHAPRGFNELVGNTSIVRKLSEWLRDWDDVVLRGNAKKVAFRPGGGQPDNINARAALISGPPGIGKTTTVRLVAQLHGGYEILEYNASDARGQKVIQEMASGIADNTTINFKGACAKRTTGLTKRALIIMDEVDGMGAGDRGGNAALMKMIKKTKNPIICICNDQHSPKIRSLAFSCYDLKFSRPTKNTIAERCAEIARKEGLYIEPNALEALAESCGSDMRMVLNQLQVLAKSPQYSSGVKYMDMKERLDSIAKDQQLMVTPFEACRKLLSTSEGMRMPFRERMDLFFIDHSLVGMLVQENYLKSVEKKPVTATLLQQCAYSADLMTIGDIINNKIRDSQDWSLLPDMGVASTVFPAHVTNGFLSFPSFPQWLGKYSTQSRTRRLATELQCHLKLAGTVRGRGVITSGYSDLLYRKLVNPLTAGGSVDATTDVLDAYGLRKEHLTEHLTELRQHLGGDDLFKLVDAKVKSALTRELNTGSGHAAKVMIPSKKRKTGTQDFGEDGEDEEGERDVVKAEAEPKAGSDGEDDDGNASSLLKVKKAKAKGKAKAKATTGDGSQSQGSTATPKAKARGKAKAKP